MDVDECTDTTPALRLGYLPCLLCNLLIYQCVTLLPCLHKFCGGCITGWTADKTTCPYCGEHFVRAYRNGLVDDRVKEYVKRRGEWQRCADDKADLSRRNRYVEEAIRTVVPTNMAIRPMMDGRPASALYTPQQQQPRPVPAYQPPPPDPDEHLYWSGPAKCYQCCRNIDGYRCLKAQEHVDCYLCKQAMPCRPGQPQQCFICELYFCNAYYRRIKHCDLGIHPVDWYIRTTFTQIPSDALYSNPFEQEVLKDALRRMGVALPMIALRAIETLNMTFNIEGKTGVQVTRGTFLCGACANALWKEMLMFQRVQVNETLPNSVRNRTKCRYGAHCKNQKTIYGHASRFSHII